MKLTRQTEADILSATVRSLGEQGYDVILNPAHALLPDTLRHFRPAGIAIGRNPKLIIEIANEGPSDAARVAALQAALNNVADWKLHLIVGLQGSSQQFPPIDDASIAAMLERVRSLAGSEPQAALLMGWAAFEALGRKIRPNDFARPQSPGRVIEQLAAEGLVTPTQATFLRSMASKRNAFIHGDLMQAITPDEVVKFASIITGMISEPAL